jgi:DNA invertase Pin-like site-specific DNA recombinase
VNISEATKIGLMKARLAGVVGGRRPVLDDVKIAEAKVMLASGGLTVTEVARRVGCSSSTLYRHLPGGRSACQPVN